LATPNIQEIGKCETDPEHCLYGEQPEDEWADATRWRVVCAGMPAYVIVETDIIDPAQYERYKAASPAAIAAGGGRFLVRGGEIAVLEGDWEPSRLVVLEFPDLAAARQWYESEVYQEAKTLREGAARLRMVAVAGVD